MLEGDNICMGQKGKNVKQENAIAGNKAMHAYPSSSLRIKGNANKASNTNKTNSLATYHYILCQFYQTYNPKYSSSKSIYFTYELCKINIKFFMITLNLY